MKIRITAVVLRNDNILLVEQNVDNGRGWSLPGGGLDEGETLEEGIIRELIEETGVTVKLKELLYVCDYIREDRHVVHITFLAEAPNDNIGETMPGLDENPIKSIAYVPIDEIESYGFSKKFKNLVKNDFPNRGSYMGDKSSIGL
jgi:ADP-ribose pyrophosphatase YjhB (NUDIX family)